MIIRKAMYGCGLNFFIKLAYNSLFLYKFAMSNNKNKIIMEKYICDVCGWEYDPAVGDPENGIEPGTAFEDLPEDWVCPLCGVGKDQFSPA